MIYGMEDLWNDNWQGKSEILAEKPSTVPLFALNTVFAVRSPLLTA
jgi:hypothetical protein